MQERIIVMTAEQYFQKYAVDGIGKGADRWMIKRQLVDAFRKEIFDLVALRTKKKFDDIPPEGDPEASRIAKNVIHDAAYKWKKLCAMFAKYKETANLIKPEDLKLYDEIEEIGTTTEDLAEEEEENHADESGTGDGTTEDAEDRSAGSEAEEERDDGRDGSDPEGNEEADGSSGKDNPEPVGDAADDGPDPAVEVDGYSAVVEVERDEPTI